MITYHDNLNGQQYGDDHMLTNNWNPNAEYGEKEYAQVHFRINAYHFDACIGFFQSEIDREEFNAEKVEVMKSLGWEIDDPSFCMTIRKGKAHLYLHPQDFSGIVLKNDIKRIAEALDDCGTFTIRWVSIHETVYDISDEEINAYLETRHDELRKSLYQCCKTKRTNKYWFCDCIIDSLGRKFRLPLIDCRSVYDSNSQTDEFISRVIDELENEGYLVKISQNGFDYVRSLNKTELKKAKLKEIV